MADVEETLKDQKRDAGLISALLSLTQTSSSVHFTYYDLEARCELLEAYWSEFQQRDYLLQRHVEQLKERTYFKQGTYVATLSSYLSAKAWFRERIQQLGAAPTTIQASSRQARDEITSTQASLERMKLPSFDGNHRDWEHFKDKFSALIVNDKKMDPIVKMQHLSNCLDKDPAEKLKTIKFTGANFETAWRALCTRYDNNYLRFSVQMQTLMAMPIAKEEQVAHLCQLINTVDDSINTFETLGRPSQQWDDILVYFIESKFAESTRKDWIKEVNALKIKDGFAKYSEIKRFIEDKIRDLDVVEARAQCAQYVESPSDDTECTLNVSKKENRKKFMQRQGQTTRAHVATKQKSQKKKESACSFCKGEHFLAFCTKFSSCSQAQRRAHALSAKLCYNCLNANHMVETCQSKGRCLVCGSKHHTKLHQDSQVVTNATATVQEQQETQGQEMFVAHVSSSQKPQQSKGMTTSCSQVLLATACVLLQGPQGQTMTARALLDSGAEESFLTEHVVQALSLKKNVANVVVSGVGGSTTAVAKSRVSVLLKSHQDTEFCFNLSALVLKKLSAMIPSTRVTTQSWTHLVDLQLADPHFNAPSRIDCILNSQAYAAILLPGIKRGPVGMPVAFNSVFGWVLMGAVQSSNQENNEDVLHTSVHHELSKAVTKFWETEEAPDQQILSPADHECYEHFRKTHSRNPEGRFVVRLPFTRSPTPLNTRTIAEACMQRLERRFAKQPDLHKAYCAFMREYFDLGHMELIPDDEVRVSDTYYLPHHPVLKNDDSSKIRVVFNASQKNAQGVSLNSLFYPGPKLQEEVIIIIINWSFYRVVFTCDVKKMFRQFLVHPEDADWQRIVWRELPHLPIKEYRLLTVTYGTVPASFLSNASMLQLADDEQESYPEGAKVIRKRRYVDDMFAGEDSLELAMEVRRQLIGTLASAGMEVGKWAANKGELLNDLDHEDTRSNSTVFEDQDTVSALGLKWLSAEDAFCFKISQWEKNPKVTKRTILSEIARLYDPVGWLSPVIISAKILLQNLWLQGIDWDVAVSEELAKVWVSYRKQLKDLELIRIPRWYGSYKNSTWDLHCFCDASERAYAVALYAVVNQEKGCKSRLIAAKSKVSPVKVISLPRLELCGASLLARLVIYLQAKLEKKPRKTFCWSDSKIVLAWLKSHPSRWKAFIANRVSEIVTSMPDAVWNHVKSSDNPADLATRGLTPMQLKDASIWWIGPDWLQQPSAMWPLEQAQEFQTEEEARTVKIFKTTVQNKARFANWLNAYSSVDKIVRILAYIYRWRTNVKKERAKRRLNWLSARELAAGHNYLVLLIQRECYENEVEALMTKDVLKSSSTLCRLLPFLDSEGVIRVGGRLQNAFLSEDEKHPIILPGKHHVTRLIIRKAHKITLHGGPTLVQSHLLRRYWIVKGRNVIRGVIRECVLCTRHRAATLEQQMGPLPAVRTRPARPFSFVGVDFAGPFPVRCSGGRGQRSVKGYVSIFICLVVRAVHIEIVSDLTTAAFLAAFRRFSARRGLCQVIYSDNGKNFQGADAEIKRLFSQTSAMSQEIAEQLAQDQVEWKYIPPRAPNFGGIWEASVKSFKTHFKRVIDGVY